MESLLGSGIVFHDIAAGIDPGPVFGAGNADLAVDAGLADEEFDPSKLNDLARFEFIAQVFTIFLFQFAHDKVCLLLGFVLAGVRFVSVQALVFVQLFLLRTVEL